MWPIALPELGRESQSLSDGNGLISDDMEAAACLL